MRSGTWLSASRSSIRDTLRYELRVDDPDTYTAPWTVAFNFKRDDDYQQYEYACHEGNYAVPNSLRGARAQERP